MKILGFNITRSQQPPVQKSVSPAIADFFSGEDVGRGGTVLSSPYQQVVWVYRAINVLAE